MRVALTGASGFIGSHTAEALKQRGHDVVALVRTSSRRDHIEPFVSEFVEGDLADRSMMKRLCDGAEAVIHNGVDWYALRKAEAGEHFRQNVLGTLDLLETARQAGTKQFLFVSSAAVNHEIVTSPTIAETHPTWPSSLYGAYKAAIEPHLKAYHFAYGMNTSSWRPAAVYGIDPNIERSQWFKHIDAARRGEQVDATGGGKITHVKDVANALSYAIGDESTSNQVYNLVEKYLYWCIPARIAAEISGSGAEIIDHRGSGPTNEYDPSKGIAFFDRHGDAQGLRRGEAGVRAYVEELFTRLDATEGRNA